MVCSINNTDLHVIKVMPNQQDNCQLHQLHHLHQQQQQTQESSPSSLSSSSPIVSNHECKRVHFEGDHSIISVPLNNLHPYSCNSSPVYCPGNHYHSNQHGHHLHHHHHHHCQHQQSINQVTNFSSTECSENGDEHEEENGNETVEGKDENEGEEEEEEILIENIDSACFIQVDQSLLMSINRENIESLKDKSEISSVSYEESKGSMQSNVKTVKPGNQTLDSTSAQPTVPATSSVDPNCPINKHITINPLEVCYHQFNGNNGNTQDQCNDESKLHQNQVYSHQQSNSTLDNLSSHFSHPLQNNNHFISCHHYLNHHSHPTYQHYHHHHHQQKQLQTSDVDTDDQPSSSPGLSENSFNHLRPVEGNTTVPVTDTLLSHLEPHQHEHYPSAPFLDSFCDSCCHKMDKQRLNTANRNSDVEHFISTNCLSQQPFEITPNEPCFLCSTSQPSSSSLTLLPTSGHPHYHHCSLLSSHPSTSTTLPMKSVKSVKHRPTVRFATKPSNSYPTGSPTLTPACHPCDKPCKHANHFQHSNDVLDHQDKVKLSTHSSTNCNNKLANNIYSYNPVELHKEPPINHEGVSYLPIIIVATILTITTVLLVIASIFFIKYLPFQKSLSSYEGICSCAFGGYCSPDSYSDNIASICRCDTFQCDSTPFDPICANDNKTYSNQCQLNFTSCNLQTPLTVQYKGKCEQNGANACDSIKCDNETICIQKSPDSPGICSCPSCSHHYEPVCASDGLFYTNECVLRRESCKENLNLRIVHSDECGGCDNVHCQFYSNCDITETGEVSCHCPKNCSQEKDPVCGSDGLNYLNECQLRLTSCQQRQYITVTSKVQCDLCSNVHCKYGAHCEAGLCVCPKDCPSIYEPVCSTDGYTYANECQMRLTACQRKLELSVTFYGECQDSQMIKRLGSTSPSSPSSPLSSFTFTASSPSSNSLTGYIDTCDQNTCRFGGVCDYDATGIPHCVCSYSCPVRDESRDEFVCGSDGRLYENECKLQEEACRRQQEVALESRDKCDGQKLLSLCDSSQPLVDPLTGLDYYCGDGPGAKICPAFSYCQKDGYHAKCCPDVALKVNCNSTTYGCCSDGLVPALGWNLAGCPEVCNCNKLGSISSTCDPITNQCQCKVGVGGLQCDRCKPGFWGLHKISEGNNGCIPCSCNKNGSVRGDCEQMTGRCVCKQGLQGVKCDICPEDALLLPQGCTHVNLTKLYPESCSTINCLFGAKCESLDEGGSRCVCNIDCSPEEKVTDKVCSSDGTIFPNECQLKIYSCRMQRLLTTLYKGPCKLFESSNANNDKDNNNNDIETITQGPLRRSTVYKTATTLVDTFKSIRQTTYINLTSSSSPSSSTVSSSSSPYLPLNTIFSAGTSKTPSSTPTPNKSSIISIPGFLGNSLIELPRLQAYSRLSIEMEFISYTESAILLYNGQTVSGEGDFVSLSIRKGHIEFRYDLGSGMVILRSKEPIVLGSTVRFVAKRYHKDGILSVEGQPDVTGSSPGSLKSLDLAENLYLGWISTNRSNVYNNIGLRSAFIGCLYRFNVDKNLRLKDILDPSTSIILRSVNVIDCLDMPCSGSSVQRLSSSVNYCHNGGTCLPLISPTDGSISSSCKCKPGYTGETCKLTIGDNICSMDNNPCIKDTVCASLPFNQGFSCFCPQDDNSLELCLNAQRKTENAFIPDFVETSYLTLPTLQNIAQTFIIEIWFLSRDINGLLFYNGQHSSHAKGDFISLNIVDSFIQFSFNLGSINPSESGLVTLRSESKISIGEWHSVRITRNRRQGGLQLDQQSMVYGEAKTNLSELNLDQPFYIGSIPGSHSTHREFNISKGFNGAIQRIVVNGHVWDDLLDRAIEIYNVAKYVGPPCESPNPCSSSNAVCVPQFNHYTCKCNSPDYSMDCTSDIPQEQ